MSITILDTDGSLLANDGSNGISIIGPDGAWMPNDGTNGISVLGADGAYQANDGTVQAYSILDEHGAMRPYEEGNTYSILDVYGSMAVYNEFGLPGGAVMTMRANNDAAVGTVETWLGQDLEGVMAFCDGDSWANIVARPAAIAADYPIRTELRRDWAVPLASNTQGIADTIAGTYDASITQLATNILANDSNDTIWIRLGWEMNLTSYPWASGNATTSQYIQAYQRVVGLFRAVSDKFIFGWIPNWGGSSNPEDWYPGDAYVDYVGMNMYFKTVFDQSSGQTGPEVWTNKRTGATYSLDYIANFAASHGKQLAIPEWGIDADEPAVVAGMAEYLTDNRARLLYHGYWDQDTPVVTKISGNQFPKSSSAYLYFFGNPVEWTPANYFGTALYDWFDASDLTTIEMNADGLVSNWTSKVGTGRSAAQGSDAAKPVWSATARNGLPGIYGDGVADYLVQTSVSGIPAGGAAASWAVQGYGYPSLVSGFKYYLSETVENTFSSSSRALGSGNGNARFQASGTVSSGQYHTMDRSVVCSIPTGATPNVSISVDGGAITTAAAAVGTFTVTRATLFAGGGASGSYGGYSETILQEIIKVNRALTTAETDKLHGYLAHKWGRASELAATHPYKANPPVLLYGPELTVMGSHLLLGTGWTWDGTKYNATATATGNGARWDGVTVTGKHYKAEVTTDSFAAGTLGFLVTGGQRMIPDMTAIGVYSGSFICGVNQGPVHLWGVGAPLTCSITHVSVKEILQP